MRRNIFRRRFVALHDLDQGQVIVIGRDVRTLTRWEAALEWLRYWWPALVILPLGLAATFWLWVRFIRWIVR